MNVTQQRLAASLAELARGLQAAHVAFAVAGAHAVAIHGHVRATTDVDVLVRAEDRGAAARVLEALGYRLTAESASFAHYVRHPFPGLAGVAENVDLLLSSRELGRRALDEAARETVPWTGIDLPVVPVHYLILMKSMARAAARREHDLADARALVALHRHRLDVDRLRGDADDIGPDVRARVDALLDDTLREPAAGYGDADARF